MIPSVQEGALYQWSVQYLSRAQQRLGRGDQPVHEERQPLLNEDDRCDLFKGRNCQKGQD